VADELLDRWEKLRGLRSVEAELGTMLGDLLSAAAVEIADPDGEAVMVIEERVPSVIVELPASGPRSPWARRSWRA
jgi:hypothetical protein